MTITSQEYANLSDLVYKSETELRQLSDKSKGQRDSFPVDGIQYKLLRFMDNPVTDYQGAVFQKVNTGEIVVAHRGSQESADFYKVDFYGMVLNRTNQQQTDALKLSQWAIQEAEKQKSYNKNPNKNITVTTTGHSLGGTLSQLMAHYLGISGETFNAYGAASLLNTKHKLYTPITNHTMAADIVSAASEHLGNVKLYANDDNIKYIKQGLNAAIKDNQEKYPLNTPIYNFGLGLLQYGKDSIHIHSNNNFSSLGKDGHHQPSILTYKNSEKLVSDNYKIIQEYRQSIYDMRVRVTSTSASITNIMDQTKQYFEQYPQNIKKQQKEVYATTQEFANNIKNITVKDNNNSNNNTKKKYSTDLQSIDEEFQMRLRNAYNSLDELQNHVLRKHKDQNNFQNMQQPSNEDRTEQPTLTPSPSRSHRPHL